MCYVTCSLRFTSGATPANLLAASMAAELSLPHTCEALVGLKTGNYHAATHSVRSGRRSTDWAIQYNTISVSKCKQAIKWSSVVLFLRKCALSFYTKCLHNRSLWTFSLDSVGWLPLNTSSSPLPFVPFGESHMCLVHEEKRERKKLLTLYLNIFYYT